MYSFLNDRIEEIHAMSLSKGWWDKAPAPGDLYSLFHAELSEAVEEVRQPRSLVYSDGVFVGPHMYFKDPLSGECILSPTYMENGIEKPLKPLGEAVEVVDSMLRVLDYFGKRGWDLSPLTEQEDLPLRTLYENNLAVYADLHYMLSTAYSYSENPKLVLYTPGLGLGGLEHMALCEFLKLAVHLFRLRKWALEEIMLVKMNYNSTRSYRHGDKVF